jgi:hypothetical protein
VSRNRAGATCGDLRDVWLGRLGQRDLAYIGAEIGNRK